MRKITIYLFAFVVAIALFSCKEGGNSGTFTDSRDGHVYKTIKIGNQVWFAENLAFKSEDGCWIYNDSKSNLEQYGYLYDWETAQNVCPSGWHLPSKDEWQTLIDTLGGEEIAGGKLKNKLNSWSSPNAGATNESGFNGLAGGYRYSDSGDYHNIHQSAFWWTSTEFSKGWVYHFAIVFDNEKAFLSDSRETAGYAVRCIKD